MSPVSPPTHHGTAHGKVIVMGEHAAVYGHTALVASISQQVTIEVSAGELSLPVEHQPFYQQVWKVFETETGVQLPELQVTLSGDLPLGVGLGGSAAVGVAMLRALASWSGLTLTDDQLLKMAYQTEQFAHGKSSGIDPTTVVKGGVLQLHREQGQLQFESLPVTVLNEQDFFLVDSGRSLDSTKTMVELVAARLQAKPELAEVMAQIGALTQTMIANLKAGQWQPELLTQNERYLEELGVVGNQAQAMIAQLEKVGAHAKILGGGGVTEGSGLLLVNHPDPGYLAEWLADQAWKNYQVRVGSS